MSKSLKTAGIGLLMFAVCIVTTNNWAGEPGLIKARMGILNGELRVHGRPLPDAIISFFNTKGGPPPVVGTARRVPDLVSRTDLLGKFSVMLLPGSYYMGAMIRERGQGPGPPRPGEHFFFARDAESGLRSFEIKTQQATDAGTITAIAPEGFGELGSFMTIRGVIRDDQGKLLSGIMVTLKSELSASRPKFISARTKEDGRYELKVPPGKYYLMAHESILGGRPEPGNGIGMYGRAAPSNREIPVGGANGFGGISSPGEAAQNGIGVEALPVEGKHGAVIENINITLFALPDPGETQRKYKEQALADREESVLQEKAESVR